jgi:integrase
VGPVVVADSIGPWASTTSRTAGAGSCAGRRTASGTYAASPTRPRRERSLPRSERRGRRAPWSDGVYAYETGEGIRYRFLFRQADGSLSTRRGFTSRRAAVTARRRLIESIERGEVKPARETFGEFWNRYLEERRPYLTSGTLIDYEAHGRKRLLPTFGSMPLVRIDEATVRRWMRSLTAETGAAGLSPKTVNNARTILWRSTRRSVRASSRGTPAWACRPCRVERQELEYLRMHEIGPYLDACADYYRPLADLLGSGLRISEALALRFGHLDFEHGVIRVYGQRDRQGDATKSTKGKRFRSAQIGPSLSASLVEMRRDRGAGDDDWLFLCPPPKRGRYSGRTAPVPPSRKTVHDWREAALVDAALRDMPLHALRHTAAAAWLATGHPLIFVQRQLGHRSIATTGEHYGHLELSFVQEAVLRTEEAIAAATPPRDHGGGQAELTGIARPRFRGLQLARWLYSRRLRLRLGDSSVLDPGLELAEPKANGTIRTAETDTWDAARLRGVVQPRSGDAEQGDYLRWPKEMNVRGFHVIRPSRHVRPAGNLNQRSSDRSSSSSRSRTSRRAARGSLAAE